MEEYKLKNSCPYCGYFSDRAATFEKETRQPEIGDRSICIKCAKLSEFDENLKLIKSNIRLLDIEDAQEVRKIQVLIKNFIKYSQRCE
jgi:hypothetical protein